MAHFRFRGLDGKDVAPREWLKVWEAEYPDHQYAAYDELLARHPSFSSVGIEQIGRWKDAAITDSNPAVVQVDTTEV
jgi:hypothetical protein